MKKVSIFLDMDEVLVDFTAGALKIHGWTREELNAKRIPGVWSIVGPMGLTLDEFWAPIHDAGEWFWLDLEPLPWIEEVLNLVRSITDEWHIVSAPSRGDGSYSGKVKWLKRYFGPGFDQFLLTPHKHLFAKPGTMLIDDREKNCEDFVAAGGRGVLFPSLGNCLHRHANNPVVWVTDYLGSILDASSIQKRQ